MDVDALCQACGEPLDAADISVEAFEITGQLLCPECADDALADDEPDGCCPGCGACPGFIGAECDGDCEHADAED
ncbi:hypothetical protein [Synechococcus phage Ssp-JY42]|nr:hypothetical protein [Synechococcus phage Yong-M4-211]